MTADVPNRIKRIRRDNKREMNNDEIKMNKSDIEYNINENKNALILKTKNID